MAALSAAVRLMMESDLADDLSVAQRTRLSSESVGPLEARGSRWIRFALVLALAGLVGGACGAASRRAILSTPSTTDSRPGAIGAPVASAVESLPVPSNAALAETSPIGASQFAYTYALPQGVTLLDLNQWYQNHLPEGVAWHDWRECPLGVVTFVDGGLHRTWQHAGRAMSLATSIHSSRTGPASLHGRVSVFIAEFSVTETAGTTSPC